MPAAIAGPSLWATRLSGKLKGLIAPTTPKGTRIITPSLPAPEAEASIGTVPPVSLRASTAEKVSVSTQRCASTFAVLIGLPASAAIVRPSSSTRSPTSSAARSRTAARACWGKSAVSKASCAARAARSTSAASPWATLPTGVPS